MKFFVKQSCDLSKYGFVEVREGCWFWHRPRKFGHGGVNMVVYTDDFRLTFQSASADAIAIVCQMYANDDIIIVDENDLYNMLLTEEEYNAVVKMRKGDK